MSRACVRFARLSDVDLDVITDLVREAARLGPAGAAHA